MALTISDVSNDIFSNYSNSAWQEFTGDRNLDHIDEVGKLWYGECYRNIKALSLDELIAFRNELETVFAANRDKFRS